MIDLLIKDGVVHTAARTFKADIGVDGGKIVSVESPGRSAAARETLDARGLQVIPGCIDVHVHLALPFCGTVSCDDFWHGSRAAASGCITSLIDFAIPGAGQSLAAAHEVWMAKARESLVDYSWHMAITSDAHVNEIPAMVAAGLPTFKEFMIYESEGWNSDDARMFATLEMVKKSGGMLLVHAESSRVLDELIRRHHTPELMKKHGARLHPMTRPNFVEAEAVERAIHWCKVTGGRLYIVHMSTGEGADMVARAQAAGTAVFAETCIQYLVLDDSVFEGPDGHLFACCPQVKKRADVERLWQGLGKEVCVVSTDTCSFTREQKGMWWQGEYGDWTKIPMGLPGLDTMVPLLYTHGVRAGRLTMNQLVDLCSTTPARVMGMANKGDIAPGMDADLALIDPSHERVVDHQTLQSRADWSPYQGQRLRGWAKHTLVRGALVVREYEVVGRRGHGVFMKRALT